MANYLAQFQTIKNSLDHLVIAENLPAEFILTTDSRLRSRFPQEQSLFWFREPYATAVLVTCEDLDEFKTILKPRLKLIVQNDEREWFIVFISKAHPNNDQATKLASKVYAKLEVDFSSKKRERCCKFDLYSPEANFWEDLESKIMECIRNTLDRRVQFYEDEIRKLSEQRFMPVWNFCNFFILKESLAFMFEMAHLHEDSLREYDELEICYLETVEMNGTRKDFGGVDHGDDQAALLNSGNKSLTQIVQDDSFREFEFRQYLFACQAKVFKPRPLVDLVAAVSSGLLINEPQWVGIIVRPINYSLKGAVLYVDTGPGLKIEDSHFIEMESYADASKSSVGVTDCNDTLKDGSLAVDKSFEKLTLCDDGVEFPHWASNSTSILWIPVRAISEKLTVGSSSVVPQRQSIVDGMRMIALKLEFGVSHNQIFERTLAVHFTDPFHVSTRVTDKCNDGTLLLQVILHSEVKATVTIFDAWLDLQDGFVNTGQGDGRPTSAYFPLVVSPNSKAGMLFSICLGKSNVEDEAKALQSDSILNIRYGISGDRTSGAHPPVSAESSGSEGARQDLIFRSTLALQRPVLDPVLAVGFLTLSSGGLRVGQLVTMKWRVERLKDFEGNEVSPNNDEVLYEVGANAENWMIAGRKRGHVSLSAKQGSRIEISILCVPLVAGYVRPPQLGLPDVGESNISCSPAGPHLVCILPPVLSSSFCIPA
ncbi:hypothetical protein C1H46_017766 [Malus baccata]|uniref:Trafficking protein particle complex subunit 11 domain-containing protein n=1 Tax=Malus baccata TaxID=106549 RepID=A0A540MD33_MALBA|nr:hypothetical protein C1H46_017766 [Malus baccata]